MSKSSPNLRSLPRLFLPGVDPEGPIELPQTEIDKFRKVLRLAQGDQIAILPNDGTLIRCSFEGRQAIPIEVVEPKTESTFELTIAQALPKGDRIETVLRMGTEIGVSRFILFPAVRSVAVWEQKKIAEKFRRLEAILRESAEQSYRSKLPKLEWHPNLAAVLKAEPDAIVLSELEGLQKSLGQALSAFPNRATLVIGPEGGWDPKEIALIGPNGVTLGPLVLRTDTAGVAAASLALLR